MSVKELDPNQLASLLDADDRIELIDVRTPAEVSRGIIARAENLPLHLLPIRADEFPSKQKVVFYCRTGARSAQACMFMNMRGYDEVYNLRGGIMSWVLNGLPVSAPSP
jgi:rhodanese-related sulfurtransferase